MKRKLLKLGIILLIGCGSLAISTYIMTLSYPYGLIAGFATIILLPIFLFKRYANRIVIYCIGGNSSTPTTNTSFFGRSRRKFVALGIIFLILFTLYVASLVVYHKTVGNNDGDHWTRDGHIATCEISLFSQPKNCKTTTLPVWCEGHGGTWNATTQTCSDISFFACHEARGVSYDSPNCFVPPTHCYAPLSYNKSMAWYGRNVSGYYTSAACP